MSRNKLESHMAQNGHEPCPEKSKGGLLWFTGYRAVRQELRSASRGT